MLLHSTDDETDSRRADTEVLISVRCNLLQHHRIHPINGDERMVSATAHWMPMQALLRIPGRICDRSYSYTVDRRRLEQTLPRVAHKSAVFTVCRINMVQYGTVSNSLSLSATSVENPEHEDSLPMTMWRLQRPYT